MKKKIKKAIPKAFISFIGIVTIFVLCGLAGVVSNYALAAQDNEAPNVTAFSLTPDSVNTNDAARTITLNMTLTDNQAGVCIEGDGDCSWYTQVRLKAPSGDQFVDFWTFTRTSGNATNGTYTGTASLPRYSAPGTWSLDYLYLYDKVTNVRELDKSDLESLLGSGVSDFNNAATVYDNTDPNVTAFNISPSTINTDDADQTVTVTFTLTDDRTGVCIFGDSDCAWTYSQLQFNSPRGTQTIYANFFNRTSGNATNGTYTTEAIFPEGSIGGTWSVEYLLLYDKVGNKRYLYKSDLESLFGSDIADVRNNAVSGDNTAPNVTAFEITPTEINTNDESQTLTLNLTLTDDRAGVCTMDDVDEGRCSYPSSLRITPLIGTQFVTFSSLTRTSGNSLNGNYTATVTMPQGSKEGVWQADHLFLDDMLENDRIIDAEELNRLLPDAEGLTITNTAEASSVTIEREWTISSDNTSVTFPAGTEVTREDGGSFAFYRMTNEEYSIEELEDEGMEGVPVLAIRFGIPGLNLSFDQDVTISFNVGSEYNGETLLIQSLEEGVDSWANETECVVNEGQCSFTVDHASYILASYIPDGDPSSSGGVYDERNNTLVDLKPVILTTSGPGEPTRLQAYSKGNTDSANSLLEEDITGLFPDSYTGGAGIVPIDQSNNYVLDQFLIFAINNGGPQVLVRGLKEDGSLSSLGQMFVFDSSIRDGLSATSGDFDNDGHTDDAAFCLTGDRTPEVRVYTDVSGIDNWELADSFTAPFGNVGCNLNTFQYNDGADEILVTPNHGPSEPYVYIYKADGTLLYDSFLAYETSINQGLTAASVNDRIYTTPNNGSSHVRAFDRDGNPKNFWWVYQQHVRGDFTIRAGQLDPTDDKEELLISPIGSNGPHILGYRASGIQKPTPNFFAFNDETLRNGVGIAVIENWHGVN